MTRKKIYSIVVSLIALIVIGISSVLIWKHSKQTTYTSSSSSTNRTTGFVIATGSPSQYIEISNACDWEDVGTCVNMRTGAGTQYSVFAKLRNGVVLKVGGTVVVGGQTWYKIIFAGTLVHPERVPADLYVAQTDSVKLFTDNGDQTATRVNPTTTKRIVVDISQETLYAYDGNTLFMKEPISTGLEYTPTPTGTFFILKKTPSRYMQGPTPGGSDQVYDLPGVPWDLYFTNTGDVIHGAYWHNDFGQPHSHGCVNLPLAASKTLYQWAEAGTPVFVQN